MSTHEDEGIFSSSQRKIIAAVLLTVILCIIGIAFILSNKGKEIAKDEVDGYLSELSYQTSYKVRQRIEENINILSMVDAELKEVSKEDQTVILEKTIASFAFDELGYIDHQGRMITNKGTIMDVSGTNILSDLTSAPYSMSETLMEWEDGSRGVIYAVKVDHPENIAFAGWVPMQTMDLLLDTDTFEGIGFSHIITRNGDYILKSGNENSVLSDGANFFDMLEKKGTVQEAQEIDAMKENLAAGSSGQIVYETQEKGERALTYTPLKIADWYVLSIVPPDRYVSSIHQFTTQSIVAVAVCSVILFTILLISTLYVTSKKNKEIIRIAYIDPITKGHTKAKFEQEWIKRGKDFSPFTYVLLDIRKFKLINDLKGSSGGNDVLKYVYNCIQKHLYEDEFVSRIQADHFELIFHTVDKQEINTRLQEIAEEINAFNATKEDPYYLPIDCGIYIVHKSGEDLVIIRDRANAARKNNKENTQMHLCSCIYYNDLERLQMVQEKELDNAMEKALKNEEFTVYLQPKVDIQKNKVAGAEALIRWISPTMGFLPPDRFIPHFEKNGFIVKLDLFVFEKVCQQIRKWIDEGREPIPISVNLSRRDLYESKYIERYKEIQKKYDVPSYLLEIEFTETLFFEDLELLKQSIQEVHDAGYHCSIDDFGSGYSSLALLKEIPMDILKIDKVFFDDESSTRGEKLVEHVIALAKDLHMTTIAEGVETLAQVERLKNVKCDLIQGYVYYKPMTLESFSKIVENDYNIIDL